MARYNCCSGVSRYQTTSIVISRPPHSTQSCLEQGHTMKSSQRQAMPAWQMHCSENTTGTFTCRHIQHALTPLHCQPFFTALWNCDTLGQVMLLLYKRECVWSEVLLKVTQRRPSIRIHRHFNKYLRCLILPLLVHRVKESYEVCNKDFHICVPFQDIFELLVDTLQTIVGGS